MYNVMYTSLPSLHASPRCDSLSFSLSINLYTLYSKFVLNIFISTFIMISSSENLNLTFGEAKSGCPKVMSFSGIQGGGGEAAAPPSATTIYTTTDRVLTSFPPSTNPGSAATLQRLAFPSTLLAIYVYIGIPIGCKYSTYSNLILI